MSRAATPAPPTPRTGGGRPPMDPRVRARRIAVARAEGRRRLHRLAVVVAALVLAVVAWGVVRSPVFAVHRVEVAGTERLTVDEVVTASGIERGERLWSLRPTDAALGVAGLPPVAAVEVEKRWPRTVRITVVERLPLVSAVLDDGSTALIDATGRTIATVGTAPPGLLRLEGPGPVPAPGGDLPVSARLAVAAAASLPPSLASEVQSVRWTDTGEAELGLLADRTARLGGAAALSEQFVALATVLAGGDVPEGAVIDVRVPRAPVVVPPVDTASTAAP